MDTVTRGLANTSVFDTSMIITSKLFADPSKILEVIFDSGPRRLRLLKSLLQQLYPDTSGYWSQASDNEQIEANCIEVCQWFGLTSDPNVVRGNCTREEQEVFWKNVFLSISDCEDVRDPNIENVEVPVSEHVKSLIKRSEDIVNLIGNAPASDSQSSEEDVSTPLSQLAEIAATKIKEAQSVMGGLLPPGPLAADKVSNDNLRGVIQDTLKAMDSFMKLYFVNVQHENKQTSRSADYNSGEMVQKLKDICKDVEKVVIAAKGVRHVFDMAAVKLDESTLV